MTLWVIGNFPASWGFDKRSRAHKARPFAAHAGLLAHSSSQGSQSVFHGRIKMGIAAALSTRLFETEPQNPIGLAGLHQFAAGCLAEMLEILGGAGVCGEHFVNAA